MVKKVDTTLTKITKLLDALVEQYNKLKKEEERVNNTIASYEHRLKSLEDRLQQAEFRLNSINVNPSPGIWPSPFIPPQPFPAPYNPFPQPFPYTSPFTCSKCGINWSGAMGYVCGSYDCPMQAKVTCDNKITLSDGQSSMGDSNNLSVSVTWTGTATDGNIGHAGDFPTKY